MSRRTRLAIVMPELFHGGAEAQFRMLIDNVAIERFDVTVFVEQSYGDFDRSAAEDWMVSRQARVRFVTLRGLTTNSGNLSRLFSAAKLAMYLVPYLRRREFDVTVVYSALGMRMTPLLRVFRVHSIFSERNDAVYSTLNLLRKRPYFSAADTIVCNSSAAAENFVKYGYCPIVIQNAVALPGVADATMEKHNGGCVLLVPGRIAPVKNQHLVLEALPAMSTTVSRVRLAGAVEDAEYLAKLEHLIDSIGWSDRVEVLGFVQDMESLYASCDLVVLPSRAEGMPNVLLESLVRRVPCVASDIPSNREVIRDDRFLFQVDDPKTLVAAVATRTQLTDAEAQEVSDTQRDHVMQQFSTATMVGAYERLFSAAQPRGAYG